MLSRFKFVAPFAVAGLVCLTVAGSQGARAQGTSRSSTGSSYSSSSSSGSNSFTSSLGSQGLSSAGLGTSSSGSSGIGNVLGSSTGSSAIGGTALVGPYLGEPLAYGNPSTYSSTSTKTPTFGQALYSTTSTTSTNRGGKTGTATVRSTANTTNNTGSTFTSANAFRSNAAGYTTQIKFAVPAPASAVVVQADLRQAIANATEIPSRRGVTVAVENGVVVLRGKVDTGEERRILESLVRMSDGVNEVRNEIEAQRPAE